MKEAKTRIKFTQNTDTGEMVGFVSRNTKTSLLRGVAELSEYPKSICVLSKELKGTIEADVLYDVELKPMLVGNGYVVVSAERTLFDAKVKTTRVPHEVYRIDISFGNKTIYFAPREGHSFSYRTVEGVCNIIDKRNDLSQKDEVKNRFIREAKNLLHDMENDQLTTDSIGIKPVKKKNAGNGLKKKMSYDKMADHMSKNSLKIVNKVNVGLYAKRLGYSVYKPMMNGRIYHFYVNKYIEESGSNC